MSTIIQYLPVHVFRRSKSIPRLVLVIGLCFILFYYGISKLHESFPSINYTVRNFKSADLVFWTMGSSERTVSTLCVVTRIYYAQIPYFPVFALALYHVHLQNIRIYLVNTDARTDLAQLEQTVQFINQLVLRTDFVILLDLGRPPVDKNYGYAMTDRALTYLYQQHTNSPSTCQYVTFTNADNFYSRNFIKKILPHMQAEKDIIGWGYVSHHPKPQHQEHIPKMKTVPEIVDDATEKCAPAIFKKGYMDLGAVAYRLSFLQEHNLYFLRPDRTDIFQSDGYFVDDAGKRTNSSVLLRQTLFVHQ